MANAQPINPLSEEQYQKILEGIAAAEEGLRQVALAKRANIDTGTAEADLNQQLDRLRQIRQVYFPGR